MAATRWRWPPGELHAALADPRVVAVRQRVDKLVRLGGLRGLDHAVADLAFASAPALLPSVSTPVNRPYRMFSAMVPSNSVVSCAT